jgi:hypothetical protein
LLEMYHKVYIVALDKGAIALIYPGQGMSIEYITSQIGIRLQPPHTRCNKCGSFSHFGMCVACGYLNNLGDNQKFDIENTNKGGKRMNRMEEIINNLKNP